LWSWTRHAAQICAAAASEQKSHAEQ